MSRDVVVLVATLWLQGLLAFIRQLKIAHCGTRFLSYSPESTFSGACRGADVILVTDGM